MLFLLCHDALCRAVLCTAATRAREKLMDRRNRLIEDVIKHDPDYKPPADYRWHRSLQLTGGGWMGTEHGLSLSRVTYGSPRA